MTSNINMWPPYGIYRKAAGTAEFWWWNIPSFIFIVELIICYRFFSKPHHHRFNTTLWRRSSVSTQTKWERSWRALHRCISTLHFGPFVSPISKLLDISLSCLNLKTSLNNSNTKLMIAKDHIHLCVFEVGLEMHCAEPVQGTSQWFLISGWRAARLRHVMDSEGGRDWREQQLKAP